MPRKVVGCAVQQAVPQFSRCTSAKLCVPPSRGFSCADSPAPGSTFAAQFPLLTMALLLVDILGNPLVAIPLLIDIFAYQGWATKSMLSFFASPINELLSVLSPPFKQMLTAPSMMLQFFQSLLCVLGLVSLCIGTVKLSISFDATSTASVLTPAFNIFLISSFPFVVAGGLEVVKKVVLSGPVVVGVPTRY